MNNKVHDNQIPCIVDRGIIFSKRDMVRVLQGLDQVEYTEVVDNKKNLTREGYIVEIFEDHQEATIFLNRRIYLNVNSFDYIQIHYTPEQNSPKETYSIDLVMPGRTISMKPLNDPIDNPTTLIAEVEERRRGVAGWEEVVAEVDED